jgi:4'-phosphopantetheinyl transferase
MASSQLRIYELRDAELDSVSETLTPDVVHLWRRSLQQTEDSIQACHQLLLPEEREKASRYRVERPRSDYILTRGTLRSLLSKYLAVPATEIAFHYTEYGKPFLHSSALRFNVSHTEGLALMAFALKREIGVDVERVRPQRDVRQLAERFFSVHERRSLRDLSGSELHHAFFRCWTRKEAYIKAVGEGLSMPLHQFDVSIEPTPVEGLIATRPDRYESRLWTIRNVPVDSGYAAALAVQISAEE